ncbi:hypothetical protein GCM10010358_80570 [Streptomyces minutiscleroticus]|uniref:Uncharacterized protein n=1 Tax=Streptomyces minutiscleroticus TaxID=68238 RepID=A0A918P3I1_9ACTN|nr:hypothetical protein [Streptomyces minutiscleroticus]GGY16844.1 hypothetical protein GCM10010358_80570 [Streptomyces minutiscleroticus]
MTDAADSTDAPFDPFDFPADLIAAQREAAELHAELHRFQATLPWSREPHDGWQAPEQSGGLRGYGSSRPATGGWTPEQAATYDRLWQQWREKATEVHQHAHWKRCTGTTGYEARQALKQLPEAQPVVPVETPGPTQDDVTLTG